jgi:hypothetical protein
MNPWLETIFVTIIALSGVFVGRVFSRLRSPYWLWGYLLSLLLIGTLVISRVSSTLCFLPPFAWIATGRVKWVILALAVPMGLITPLPHLPRKFEKVTTCFLMAIVVIWFSILPFLAPALIKNHLLNLETRIDINGICYQSSDYTCAPAAAVTALRKLGFPANEGQIAVLAHTSPVAGTLPGCLSSALQRQYGSDGLRCEYRRFDSVAELKTTGITLAIIRDTFLSDHCVTVLDVSNDIVVVADPVLGRNMIPHRQFEQIWRFTGIVLEREPAESI